MNTALQPLLAKLKACPSYQATVSRERFIESWDNLVREDVTPYSKPTLPVLAALVMADHSFTRLLNELELAHFKALVQRALERYEQQTNPPNKLGRLIADCVSATIKTKD